jgi:hypothetical protein
VVLIHAVELTIQDGYTYLEKVSSWRDRISASTLENVTVILERGRGHLKKLQFPIYVRPRGWEERIKKEKENKSMPYENIYALFFSTILIT